MTLPRTVEDPVSRAPVVIAEALRDLRCLASCKTLASVFRASILVSSLLHRLDNCYTPRSSPGSNVR